MWKHLALISAAAIGLATAQAGTNTTPADACALLTVTDAASASGQRLTYQTDDFGFTMQPEHDWTTCAYVVARGDERSDRIVVKVDLYGPGWFAFEKKIGTADGDGTAKSEYEADNRSERSRGTQMDDLPGIGDAAIYFPRPETKSAFNGVDILVGDSQLSVTSQTLDRDHLIAVARVVAKATLP